VTATAGRGHALPLTIEEHSALLQGSPFGLDATQMPCISGRGADFGSLLIVVGDEQDLHLMILAATAARLSGCKA